MVEAFSPEEVVVAQPVGQGRESVGVGAVVDFATVAAVANEPGAFEDGEVFGDGGLGDAGVGSEGVDGLFAVLGEVFEEVSAGGVGEGAEDGIGFGRLHGKTITVWLWIVNSCAEGEGLVGRGWDASLFAQAVGKEEADSRRKGSDYFGLVLRAETRGRLPDNLKEPSQGRGGPAAELKSSMQVLRCGQGSSLAREANSALRYSATRRLAFSSRQ